MKKWRDLSYELHETSMNLKNEFQETSLAATLNLRDSTSAMGNDKRSAFEESDEGNATEDVQVEYPPDSKSTDINQSPYAS